MRIIPSHKKQNNKPVSQPKEEVKPVEVIEEVTEVEEEPVVVVEKKKKSSAKKYYTFDEEDDLI